MSAAITTQSVGDFAAAVASDAPTPGGGAVAGTVAALGAALVGMAGRYAQKHDPASAVFPPLMAAADRLRLRAGELADADAQAYGRYLDAARSTAGPEARATAIRAALDAAADVPFELGGLAVEVAEAAEELAVLGNQRLRPDACTAALLASAVASSAALLVEENLHGQPDDPRVAGAARHVRAATAAADRAMGAHRSPGDRVRT